MASSPEEQLKELKETVQILTGQMQSMASRMDETSVEGSGTTIAVDALRREVAAYVAQGATATTGGKKMLMFVSPKDLKPIMYGAA